MIPSHILGHFKAISASFSFTVFLSGKLKLTGIAFQWPKNAVEKHVAHRKMLTSPKMLGPPVLTRAGRLQKF